MSVTESLQETNREREIRAGSYGMVFNTPDNINCVISSGKAPLIVQGRPEERLTVYEQMKRDLNVLSRFQPLEILTSINHDFFDQDGLISYSFGTKRSGLYLIVDNSYLYIGLIRDPDKYNQGLFSTMGLGVGYGSSEDEALQVATNNIVALNDPNIGVVYYASLINAAGRMAAHNPPFVQVHHLRNAIQPQMPQRQNVAVNPVVNQPVVSPPIVSPQPIQAPPLRNDGMDRAAAAYANERQQVARYIQGPTGLPASPMEIDQQIQAERMGPMGRLPRLNDPLGLNRSGLPGSGLGGGGLGGGGFGR